MKTTKKGFTLIELMVVIVIIGILAAIAIPKLFGMTAKAKASEVGPAAGTWSKLQQAYVVETNKYGGFKKISYKSPDENVDNPNFRYNSSLATDTEGEDLNAGVTWTATNAVNLGDCATNSAWLATISQNNTGLTVTGAAPASNIDCSSLTPNFSLLK